MNATSYRKQQHPMVFRESDTGNRPPDRNHRGRRRSSPRCRSAMMRCVAEHLARLHGKGLTEQIATVMLHRHHRHAHRKDLATERW